MARGQTITWALLLLVGGILGFMGGKFASPSRPLEVPVIAPIAVSEQSRQAMRQVMEEDIRAAKESFAPRTNYVTSYLAGAVAVRGDAPAEAKLRDYLARARQLSTDQCPDDFRLAYLLHIQAWEKKLQSVRQGEDSGELWGLVAVAGLVGARPDIAASGANEYAQKKQQAKSKRHAVDDQITETWHKVEQVAAKYGVWIPERI